MTQFPDPPPPQPETMNYASAGARVSGMAITSLVLGVLAIVTACFGMGILLSIVGLILGIVGLNQINREPLRYGGKGFAIAGITTSALAIPIGVLLIAIMLPSLGKARELSNRSVCAANLRGLTQSMVVYSNDNTDAYPITKVTGRNDPYMLSVPSIIGTSNADLTITRAMYDGPGTNNPPQNQWILVLKGQVSAKQFICKSDPSGTKVGQACSTTGEFFTTFNDGTGPSNLAYSYSFAYPLQDNGSIGGWWKNTTDASLPLVADICPVGAGVTTSTPTSRNANSMNHQRDGQTVGYGDGHAEFARRPDVGQANDNIYTTNRGVPSTTGTPYSGAAALTVGGGAGAFDIVLVPCADVSSGARR